MRTLELAVARGSFNLLGILLSLGPRLVPRPLVAIASETFRDQSLLFPLPLP